MLNVSHPQMAQLRPMNAYFNSPVCMARHGRAGQGAVCRLFHLENGSHRRYRRKRVQMKIFVGRESGLSSEVMPPVERENERTPSDELPGVWTAHTMELSTEARSTDYKGRQWLLSPPGVSW